MSPRVLLAEDSDQLAAAIEALLKRQGLTVERAGDGVEALGRIAKSPPDLLLLDLKLPRLHGIELLKKLRQNTSTRALPVVIITGAYRGNPYVRAAKALGVSVYLEKPFKAGELLAALKQALPANAPVSPPAPKAETVDCHLRRAFIGRFFGRLVLRGKGREYSLTFISGTPVFVCPGFAYRDFGDWLHRRGFLSAGEYDFYAGPGQHRYELPVQMGCIQYPNLLEEKLAYLSAELVESFALPPLAAEKHPFTPPPGLQEGPRYAALAPDYFRYANFLSLNHEERQLLPRLDGTRPLAECLAGEMDLTPTGADPAGPRHAALRRHPSDLGVGSGVSLAHPVQCRGRGNGRYPPRKTAGELCRPGRAGGSDRRHCRSFGAAGSHAGPRSGRR
jgi:CheY-like chemotaxis protein